MGTYGSVLDAHPYYDTVDPSNRRRAWYGVLAGAAIALLLFHFLVSRPVRRELALLQLQVEVMRESLDQLVVMKPAAAATTDLVSQLAKQHQVLIQANSAMQRIEQLPGRIAAVTEGLNVTLASLNKLQEMRDSILNMSERLQQACDVVTRIEVLNERLAQSSRNVDEAVAVADQALQMSENLQTSAWVVEAAQHSLAVLTELQERLAMQSSTWDQAIQRVQDLIMLKDTILTQTSNLADAIETLELTNDLSRQFRQAASAFSTMRQWMLEVSATQPVLEQAREALAPILELGNLRRLDGDRLRQLAREVGHRMESPAATESEPVVDNSNPFDVFGIDWTTSEASVSKRATAIEAR